MPKFLPHVSFHFNVMTTKFLLLIDLFTSTVEKHNIDLLLGVYEINIPVEIWVLSISC
jgi:hypothetical protein